MTIANEIRNKPWLHYLGLSFSFAYQVASENLSFHISLTAIFFPNNIWSNFTLILLLKFFEMATAAVNRIKQPLREKGPNT